MQLSTYSATEQHLNELETKQADTTTIQDNTQQIVPDANTIIVPTPDAQSQTTQQTQPEATTEQASSEPDFSNAELSFNFGDEKQGEQQQSAPAAQPQQYNWKDEIKKVDQVELLKELGLSEFAIEIDKHIKGGGQPVEYLNAKAVDYNQVSDDALLKDSLSKEYPNLKPEQIDLMFNRKYGVSDTAEEEDREFINMQKQADAYKVRQQKIAEQQKFKIPDTPIPQKDEAYEQWKQMQDELPKIAQERVDFFTNHAATKALNENKKVAIELGEGVKPLNFTVNQPEFVTRAFIDNGELWQKVTSLESGEPDVPKQQLTFLFATNPQKFMQAIFNYGKQMGERKPVEEGQNARRPGQVLSMEHNQTPTYKVGKFGGGN